MNKLTRLASTSAAALVLIATTLVLPSAAADDGIRNLTGANPQETQANDVAPQEQDIQKVAEIPDETAVEKPRRKRRIEVTPRPQPLEEASNDDDIKTKLGPVAPVKPKKLKPRPRVLQTKTTTDEPTTRPAQLSEEDAEDLPTQAAAEPTEELTPEEIQAIADDAAPQVAADAPEQDDEADEPIRIAPQKKRIKLKHSEPTSYATYRPAYDESDDQSYGYEDTGYGNQRSYSSCHN
jgi:hypothetical protein